MEKLVETIYDNFHVITSTPTLEDEMWFTVVVGMWWMDFVAYRKTRRIVVEKDPDGWDEERRMLKRHLRLCLCTKGWKIC